MRSQQATQKGGHDIHARNREFTVGTRVLVGDLRDPSHWNPDIVCECHGPLSYVVEMDSGKTVHWHVDHLQKLVSVSQEPKEEISSESGTSVEMAPQLTCTPLSPGMDSPQGKPKVAPPLEGGSPAKQPAEQPMILSPPMYVYAYTTVSTETASPCGETTVFLTVCFIKGGGQWSSDLTLIF